MLVQEAPSGALAADLQHFEEIVVGGELADRIEMGAETVEHDAVHVDAPVLSGPGAARQAVLVDMYRNNNENDKSAAARKKASSLAQEVVGESTQQGDWKARALVLAYKLEQNVPVYGSQE